MARAVLFAMVDPDDETARVLGQPKNNLGRIDLPTLGFHIVTAHVADTADGPVHTGCIQWTGVTPRSLRDVIEAASEAPESRTATSEAAEWLRDWLTSQGGTDASASAKTQGQRAGHSHDALKRARRRLGVVVDNEGFPRRTYWTLPGTAARAGAAAQGSTEAIQWGRPMVPVEAAQSGRL